MRYLFLFSVLLIFSACVPKYKTTYTYSEPISQTQKDCISSCDQKRAICRAKCKSNFDTCRLKAIKIAKKQYQEKLQNYYKALEVYANQVQMNNLENELYSYDDFYFPRRGYGYWGPFGPYWAWSPRVMYHVQKPVKPTLQQEIVRVELQECQIDCKCQTSYDRCFIGCGGKITSKKICIQNCPHE